MKTIGIILICALFFTLPAYSQDKIPNIYESMPEDQFNKNVLKAVVVCCSAWLKTAGLINADSDFDYKKYWSISPEYSYICDLYDARKEINPFMEFMPIYAEYHSALKNNDKQKAMETIINGIYQIKALCVKEFGQEKTDKAFKVLQEKAVITKRDKQKYGI